MLGRFKLPVMLLLRSGVLEYPEELCLIAPHRQDDFESQVVDFVVSAFVAHLEAMVALDRVVRELGNDRDRQERGRRMQKCSWMCDTDLALFSFS